MKMYVAKNITPMESVNYLFSLRLSRALAVLFTNESSMEILWMFELFSWKTNAEQKYKHRLFAVYFVKEANDFTNVFSISTKARNVLFTTKY